MLILAVSNLAGVSFFNLYFNQPQGRYLFPTLRAAAVMMAYGWKTALESLK